MSRPTLLGFSTYYPYQGVFPALAGTEEPFCGAISSANDWNRIWDEVNVPPGTMEPPTIDFTKRTLLVLMLGEQKGACPDAFFESVLDYVDSLVATACRVDHQPCPGLTYRPSCCALVPRTDARVSFRLLSTMQQGYGGCPR